MGQLKSQQGSMTLLGVFILFSVVYIYMQASGLTFVFNSKTMSQYKFRENLDIGYQNILNTVKNPVILQKSISSGENPELACIPDFSCDPNSEFKSFVLIDIEGNKLSEGKTYGLDNFGGRCHVGVSSLKCQALVNVKWKVLCSTATPPCLEPDLILQVFLEPVAGLHIPVNFSKYHSQVLYEDAHMTFTF